MTAFSYHRSLMAPYLSPAPLQETPGPRQWPYLLQRQEAGNGGQVRRERDGDGRERDHVERVEERDRVVAPPRPQEEDRRAGQLERHDAELGEDEQVRH